MPRVLAGLLFLSGLVSLAPGQCVPGWSPTAFPRNGFDGDVLTSVVFDDGSGPALYVGGAFRIAGGAVVNHLARWDGVAWSDVGGGVTGASGLTTRVSKLAVWDDGTGLALYVGGTFCVAGSVAANALARWDGTSWSAVGGGTATCASIEALGVWDDGSGEALYVGGQFDIIGGSVLASSVARWDGTSFSSLGAGLGAAFGATPRALAFEVWDDGTGEALYVGGFFATAGAAVVNNLARWDGASWSGVGGGVTGSITSLEVFDDGGGPQLHDGGFFSAAGGAPIGSVARWDGNTFHALGSGLTSVGGVAALLAVGPDLYVGSTATSNLALPNDVVARWDGALWTSVGTGLTDVNYAAAFTLAWFDDGAGPSLFAFGHWAVAGNVAAADVFCGHSARWDGSTWHAVGVPDGGIDGRVNALCVYDDGTGPRMFAAGSFTRAGGVSARGLAAWDGVSWSAVGDLDPGGVAHALVVHDDGGGAALYVGGLFSSVAGVPASRVARWDGLSWTALGAGLPGPGAVFALASHDDGGGPALYAGGSLPTPYNGIARWDVPSGWSAMAGGLLGVNVLTAPSVHAFREYDDGGGADLYVAGSFAGAGTLQVQNIARWDGGWSDPGVGTDGPIWALAVYDAGNGDELFLGGRFTTAGGIAALNLAAWDGQAWSSPGALVDPTGNYLARVACLRVFDDGAGPALVVGGEFTCADGAPSNGAARYDGTSWSGIGAAAPAFFPVAVRTLVEFDDGAGPALHAGGDFDVLGAVTAPNVARQLPRHPVVTTPPVGGIFQSGLPLTLSVTAVGTSITGYQWFRDGVALPGASASSLTLPTAMPADSGTYTVSVTDSCGIATSPPAVVEVVDVVLTLGQPTGPTSFSIANAGSVPGAHRFTGLSFDPRNGLFPGFGSFFGLFADQGGLLAQFAFGSPFTGVMDANGDSFLSLPVGVPAYLSGLTIWGVTVLYDPITFAPGGTSNIEALTLL